MLTLVILALTFSPAAAYTPPAATSSTLDGTVPSADGVPIHFRAEGAGEPALVFVHGWTGDGGIWAAQVAEFAPRHRVVTLDLAGHGASGKDRKEWTIPAFGADVAAVVKKLGLKRVVLIGHSLGGPVNLEAALKLPRQVVLMVPVDIMQNVETRMKPEDLAAFLAPFEKDFPTAADQFMRRFFPPGTEAGIVDAVARQASAAPPAIALSVLRSVFTYDPTVALKKVKAPLRAINSDAWPTAIEVNRKYAPRFDVTIMKGVGHFPMLVAPKEFNHLLADAVGDQAPEAAAH